VTQASVDSPCSPRMPKPRRCSSPMRMNPVEAGLADLESTPQVGRAALASPAPRQRSALPRY
jgi:hypothetical protein